jgi:Raf kinase inhibitor-like YbhB/YbcL family protein
MALQVFSSAFADGSRIPELHTCDGADLSPALEWGGEPPETRSFALIVEDPDAPNGTWCHWLLYDLPVTVHAVAQGYRPGMPGLSGTNDFGKLGYGGPCPPKGHGPHRYIFKLYALDVETLGLGEGAKRQKFLQAVGGHTLGEAQYSGRFERR